MRGFLHILSIIFLIFSGIGTTACIDDDYSTAPGHVLSFSTDTLRFDTIFTDLRTPTASFKVFNRGKKMINISSIKVAGIAENATFRMNVDGINDIEFSNVDIRGGDSIFVFVQAFINHNDKSTPLEVEDKIQFVTNGVQQQVVISAWGQDAVRLRSHTITNDTVFTADKPYVVFDTLHVAKDATLTILPGATFHFHDKGMLMIDGTLKIQGESGAEVTMRGDRTDKVVGGIDFDIMSGQWNGIRFSESSHDNDIRYLNMRSCSNGIIIDSCGIENRKLYLFNSAIHNSSGSILTANHCNIEADGVEFSEAAATVVDITGGKAVFRNCTFANQYLFSMISGSIINISYAETKEATEGLPLADINFFNCIIHGNTSDINIGNLDETSVFFHNTLFRSSGENDTHFLDCIWEGEPDFYTVRNDYIFDYRLRNESDAIGIADISNIPDNMLYDRYGNSRLRTLPDGGTTADIGAYVWIKNEEETE